MKPPKPLVASLIILVVLAVASVEARQAPASAASPTAPPAPVRAGGRVPTPRPLNVVQPVYPALAKAARVQCLMVLEVTVGVEGRVQAVRFLVGFAVPEEVEQARRRQVEALQKNEEEAREARAAVAANPSDNASRLLAEVNELQVKIGRDLLKSPPPCLGAPLLEAAAIDTIRQRVYEPVRVDGRLTPVIFTVTILFELPPAEPLRQSEIRAVDEVTWARIGVSLNGAMARSALVAADIVSLRQAGQQVLVCRYSQTPDPTKVRLFWHSTQPNGMDAARLTSRLADHPMLLVGDARSECPGVLPSN